MYLPITLASAAVAAFINIWLMIRIGMIRRASGVSIGDGGRPELVCRMRAQANFVENTPFALILIAVIEASRPGNIWLAGAAALFMIGRVAHGVGMDGGPLRAGRSFGTISAMGVLLGLGVWAVTIALDM